MLWSRTRSHSQCWPWLPRFRSDLHQGFQHSFDHPILDQPLSHVARRSSTVYLDVFFWLSLVFLFVVCIVGDVDRFLCPSCSSNAVCAHSVAVQVWDVEIVICQQGIREKDVCEWWWLLQCAAWSRLVRRRMANHWGSVFFVLFAAIALTYGGLDRNHCPFSNAWLRSRSCSRVRIMCCRRHIGVLSLMWKRWLLLMPQILPRLQPFGKRCMMIISTREWRWSNRFPMFCMFWWHCWIRGTIDLASFSFFVMIIVSLLVRWRVHRTVKLTADQWNRVKSLFLQYVPQFFPNNCMLPVFVPLHGHVLTKLEELQQEIEELNAASSSRRSAAAESLPFLPACTAQRWVNHPPPDLQVEQLSRRRKEDISTTARPPAIDMDGAMQVEEKKEVKEERDVQWELAHWFSPAAPFLPWYAPQSQPDVQWKVLEPEFPRLALLARRFLSIPPTSAPSERVWSRFGRVISKQSSTIDSTIAAQIMFLRDNEHLLKHVNPFDPNSWFLYPWCDFGWNELDVNWKKATSTWWMN